MWSSAGKDLATSTEVWDDQTGETVAEAFARFSTFGPVMGAAQALAVLDRNPSADVMSFGYGDDPAEFDSIDFQELADAIEEDGIEQVDDQWGPFAVWL